MQKYYLIGLLFLGSISFINTQEIDEFDLIYEPIEQFIASSQPQTSALEEAQINQFFNEIEGHRNQGLTQSEAHLSVKKVQDRVRKQFPLRLPEIRKAALAKERELNKDYDIFYTAIPNARVYQDVTRKLYKRVAPAVPNLKEFQFIRYSYQDPTYTVYKNVTDFLISEISKNGIIDDRIAALSTILVSTNIAFFGNAGSTGESTWYFLNKQAEWAAARTAWLEGSLKSFGYSEKFVPELVELSALVKTETSDLFQICIPHTVTDQIGYLSWRVGIPFDPFYIKTVFKNVKGWTGRDRLTYPQILEGVTAFKERWARKDPEAVKAVNVLLNHVKEGRFRLTPFLETYKKSPDSLPYINTYQARLLITNEVLLNPNSGIKIYRYSSLAPRQEARYKAKLKEIFRKMDAEKAPANPVIDDDDTMVVSLVPGA